MTETDVEDLLCRLEKLSGFQLIDLRDEDWPVYLDEVDQMEIITEIYECCGVLVEEIDWSSLTQFTDLVAAVNRSLSPPPSRTRK